MSTLAIDSSAPLIDLSMSIEDHWRFSPTISFTERNVAGCAFHSTAFSMGAHGFTHVDAPMHVDPQASPLLAGDLHRFWGTAKVLDVSRCGENVAITRADLEATGVEILPGEIVLIRSNHELAHPTTTPEYWTRAPWMSREAVEWLRSHDISMIGFDFPQDRGIRSDYDSSWIAGDLLDDWPCHQILLTSGVFQVEYLCNLAAIEETSCTFFAMPLNFANSDGSPVRAFAMHHTA